MKGPIEKELIAFARRGFEEPMLPAVWLRTSYTNLSKDPKASGFEEVTAQITPEGIARFQQEIRDKIALCVAEDGIAGLLKESSKPWHAMLVLYLKAAWHDWQPYFPVDVDVLDILNRIGAPRETDFRLVDHAINQAFHLVVPQCDAPQPIFDEDTGLELTVTIAADPDLDIAGRLVGAYQAKLTGNQKSSEIRSKQSDDLFHEAFSILMVKTNENPKCVSEIINAGESSKLFRENFRKPEKNGASVSEKFYSIRHVRGNFNEWKKTHPYPGLMLIDVIDTKIAEQLVAKGVALLDDLADLSIDDFLDLEVHGIEEAQIEEAIRQARFLREKIQKETSTEVC